MGCAQGGSAGAVEPANMLWLIQRDFLEGKTVGAMLAEALATVPNPTHDANIDQARQGSYRVHGAICLYARGGPAPCAT